MPALHCPRQPFYAHDLIAAPLPHPFCTFKVFYVGVCKRVSDVELLKLLLEFLLSCVKQWLVGKD
jgi:hypothetical protein